VSPKPTEARKPGRQTCKATTNAGKPCAAPAVENGLCYFHAHPELARNLGRRGGRMNRRFREPPEGLPERPLKSVRDVTELLAETINHLRAGKLDPRVANAVGYLATAMLKALHEGDIEARLRAIEQVLLQRRPVGEEIRCKNDG